MPEAPAKIALQTDQNTILANRSGLSIIKATILDKNDIPVFDAKNTLYWQITGPGKLVGPATYKSDINEHEAWEGCGYTVSPVCNVIRSTNVPGTITVKVSSEGIESAEITVQPIAPKPNATTSLIIEEKLNGAGRINTKRIEMNYSNGFVFEELKPTKENLLIGSKDSEIIGKKLVPLFVNNSHSLYMDSKGIRVLSHALVNRIIQSNGYLIADDYNYLAKQYNIFRLLEKEIEKLGMEQKATIKLLSDYADKIINKSEPVDLELEIKKLKNKDL
jgi:beta-galactosidase